MSRGLAVALSVVFHPLLVPSYLYYVVCYQLPSVVLRPLWPERWFVLGTVVLFTFVLPTLSSVVLLRFRLLDSLEMNVRRQRAWPLLLATSSFAMAAVLLCRSRFFDALLGQMMVGMTLAVGLTFLITLRWKISAHGMGMGGALGLFALLYLGGTAGDTTLWWLVGTVLVAGAVLSARLALNAHTVAQVWAGLGLGLGLVLGLGAGLAAG
ncbi:hypothetical protein HMJ29_08345 [Hymenobacter taeanensis]|uniref:Phosphatase PAP2 family protein n=1 Tax=Hymenobacter taeanensis TaxID=2735321 RepID=A0A6M6BG41_9BACT|nr:MULTISPECIES: hypothetical protein [Hymenobacter]QJX46942.1 hypothetical protein HMJ29_08345 [Hymenobacter taeanensis]UOQ80818.1 hypothetical protein MUN83_18700 [Hymenobacter sp. 5414T-23]